MTTTTTTTTTSHSPFLLMNEMIVSWKHSNQHYHTTNSHLDDEEDTIASTIPLWTTMDDVFRAAEFLYPPCMLQGALFILDRALAARTVMSDHHHHHQPNPYDRMIRKLMAIPSRRFVYLVPNNTVVTTTSSSCITSPTTMQSYGTAPQLSPPQHSSDMQHNRSISSSSGYCICMMSNSLDPTSDLMDDDGDDDNNDDVDVRMYCSCLAFWKSSQTMMTKRKTKKKHHTTHAQLLPPCCQHLLAVQLLPFANLTAANTMTTRMTQQARQPPTNPVTDTPPNSMIHIVETIPDLEFGRRILPYLVR